MPRSSARTHSAGIAVRIVALMALLGAVCLSFAAPAGAAGTVSVTPNPVPFTTNQTDATVSVSWTGQQASQLLYIDVCKKSITDATFNVALDCSALSELNPNGTASGNGTTDLGVFRGQNPDGDAWGCFAAGDTAPAGVTKYTTCYVRVTSGSVFNKDYAAEKAFTLTVAGDVVPEAPLGILIPAVGAIVVAGAFFMLRRRAATAA